MTMSKQAQCCLFGLTKTLITHKWLVNRTDLKWKSPWLLIFLRIEKSLFSPCFKIKKHPFMYEESEQRYDKTWNTAPFVCGKTRLYISRQPGRSCSIHSLQVENPAAMVDYFCVCMVQHVSSIPCNRSSRPLQMYMFSVPMATHVCLQHHYFV